MKFMYQITRDAGRVIIKDWKSDEVYNVLEDAYLPSENDGGNTTVCQVKTLKDGELIKALVTAIKLPFTTEPSVS